MGIEEDQFEEFIAEKRYPLSIIHKMQHLSEQLKEMEKAKLQVRPRGEGEDKGRGEGKRWVERGH